MPPRVLLALLPLLLLPACGSDDVARQAAPPPGPAQWTVTTTLLQTAGQPLTACHSTLDSLPPAGCGGPEVRGAVAEDLAGAERFPNGTVTVPTTRLVGTYDDGVLTLTERPQPAAPPSPRPERPPLPVSCPEPDGGWPFDAVTQEGMSEVAAYVGSQPDGGTPRVDRSQRIMTAPFTGDLDRHRRELAARYDGPVCVEPARASTRELEALRATVEQQAEREGWGLLGGGSGNGFGTATVTVMAATADQVAAVREDTDGLVEVESFLQPV